MRHPAAFVACLGLLVALSCLPTVQADAFRLRFPESFAQGVLETDTFVSGTAAQDFRRTMDESATGDRDGNVTAAEVAAFEEETMRLFRMGTNTGDNLTVDGRKAHSGTLTAVDYEGVEGPVTSNATLKVHFVMTLYFAIPQLQRHEVLVQTAPTTVDLTITVVAPPGFGVANVTGLPGDVFLSDDRTTLTFSTGPTWGNTLITYLEGAQRDVAPRQVPAGTTWTAVAALAAGVIVLAVWTLRKR